MKRTRVLGGLLAASAALVAAIVLSLPASARQSGGPAPAYASPKSIEELTEKEGFTRFEMKTTRAPTAQVAPVPDRAFMAEIAGAMNAATGNLNSPVLAPTEKKPADSKEASVDELIARLAELKTKEAELTTQLREKLSKQQNGLKRLEKLGVKVEEENTPPACRQPGPSSQPSLNTTVPGPVSSN